MITASALRMFCAYPKVLSRDRVLTPEQQGAIDNGKVFHGAIEGWARTGQLPPVADPEIQGWAELLVSELPHQGVGWIHPKHVPGLGHVLVEEAWGLWDDGRYTPVEEPTPHVYVARGEYRPGIALLTAGRADLAFVAGSTTLVVLDWKTGKWPTTPAEMNLQVNAAGMALAQKEGVPWYLPGIYYARDGYFDWGEPVRMGSSDHSCRWNDVREAALLPPEPRPGQHCFDCWEARKKTCAEGVKATAPRTARAARKGAGMKVIAPGREQRGWAKEFECTGNGNGGGGCGAKLLVEQADVYKTHHYDYGGGHDEFNTFTCCACGVETDIGHVPFNPPDKKK